jgi:hypothetical protein
MDSGAFSAPALASVIVPSVVTAGAGAGWFFEYR